MNNTKASFYFRSIAVRVRVFLNSATRMANESRGDYLIVSPFAALGLFPAISSGQARETDLL